MNMKEETVEKVSLSEFRQIICKLNEEVDRYYSQAQYLYDLSCELKPQDDIVEKRVAEVSNPMCVTDEFYKQIYRLEAINNKMYDTIIHLRSII